MFAKYRMCKKLLNLNDNSLKWMEPFFLMHLHIIDIKGLMKINYSGETNSSILINNFYQMTRRNKPEDLNHRNH